MRWIDVINPGAKEIDYLKENFKFGELDLTDITSASQHAKFEEHGSHNTMVLLFPVFNKKTRVIRPAEVDFLIGTDYLLTIHDGSMYTMIRTFNNADENEEIRREYMGKNSGWLLYKVLESLFRRSFPLLDHISKDMNEIESGIFSDIDVSMLEKISLMKTNIIDFRRITKTHHLILKKLAARKEPYMLFHESKNYYLNLLEHSENIWDILATQKETMEAMQDANQSLATNRLNQITKVITIFSGIFLPATLILFIFGLNIDNMPLKTNPNAFWIILIIAATASLCMLLFFKKKKWF